MLCSIGSASSPNYLSSQANTHTHRWMIRDLRRSANTLEAGEIFHKIGGGRNAFGGFGHPGGEFAGPGEALRGEDGAKVRDQRFSVVVEKRRAVPTFSRLTRAPQAPDRATSRGSRWGLRRAGPRRGARAAVVHDRAAGGKDGRIIHRAHHLDVLEMRDVAEVGPGGANQRPLA